MKRVQLIPIEEPEPKVESGMRITGMVNREDGQVSLIMLKGTELKELDLELNDAREVFKALGKCLAEFDN